MQRKPNFTDFRCFTSSLGRLQTFCFIEYSVGNHTKFSRNKKEVVIRVGQQTSQKQQKITLYN